MGAALRVQREQRQGPPAAAARASPALAAGARRARTRARDAASTTSPSTGGTSLADELRALAERDDRADRRTWSASRRSSTGRCSPRTAWSTTISSPRRRLRRRSRSASARSRSCSPGRSRPARRRRRGSSATASTPITEVPAHWPADYRALVERRIALIESDPDVGLIERPEHKRRWNRRAVGRPSARRAHGARARRARGEPSCGRTCGRGRPPSSPTSARARRVLVEALELLADRKDADSAATRRRLVARRGRPAPRRQRLTDSGLRKRAVWERSGSCSAPRTRRGRRDDPGAAEVRAGRLPLAVVLEAARQARRPEGALRPDPERRARRRQLAGRRLGRLGRARPRSRARRPDHELREQDAADAERLTPLLAGVLELLPWIHQWHPETDPTVRRSPGPLLRGLARRAARRARRSPVTRCAPGARPRRPADARRKASTA